MIALPTMRGIIGGRTLGFERVLYGDFSVSTGWENRGGVTITGGVAVYNCGADSHGLVRSIVGGQVLSLELFQIEMDVISYTSGGLYVYFGDTSYPSCGPIQAAGKYVGFIRTPTNNGRIFFLTAPGPAYFKATIDNLSCRKVT